MMCFCPLSFYRFSVSYLFNSENHSKKPAECFGTAHNDNFHDKPSNHHILHILSSDIISITAISTTTTLCGQQTAVINPAAKATNAFHLQSLLIAVTLL